MCSVFNKGSGQSAVGNRKNFDFHLPFAFATRPHTGFRVSFFSSKLAVFILANFHRITLKSHLLNWLAVGTVSLPTRDGVSVRGFENGRIEGRNST